MQSPETITHVRPIERFEEAFVAVWCAVMAITGTLIVPSIQGTVPAYMLSFCSFGFVLLRLQHGEIPIEVVRYAKSAITILLLWLFFLVASQIGMMMSDRHDFSGAEMIDPRDPSIVFKTSLFTQSIYLLACVQTALYFRYFFKPAWMKYVLVGGYVLAGYGIYEWLFFVIFHRTGDFLANRTFGVEQFSASWSQTINFGGLNLLRIKSTLGEPSFFAGIAIAYLVLAFDLRKRVLAGMLFFTALFSTSTACYITLLLCLFLKSFWSGRIRMSYVFFLGGVVAFLGAMALVYPDTFNGAFMEKISGDNASGKTRLNGITVTENLLGSFTMANWLFGLGFGYVYNSVFLAILENTGLLGLGIFVWVLFRPILLLPVQPGSEGIKLGLSGIAFLFALTLSELYLPPIWMFLGLGYWKLDQLRAARRATYYMDEETSRATLAATSA